VSSESFENSRGGDAGEAYLILGRDAAGACTIAPDPGSDSEICGPPIDLLLDGSATMVTGCAATAQFRWMLDTSVVRDWSVDPTVLVSPTETTVYRLEVRCGDCAGPCFASSEVRVTVDPGIRPPDLKNVVRAVKAGLDVELTWAAVPEAETYKLYRGIEKGVWPPAIREGLSGTRETLPDVSPTTARYFYRVSGVSCSDLEGP